MEDGNDVYDGDGNYLYTERFSYISKTLLDPIMSDPASTDSNLEFQKGLKVGNQGNDGPGGDHLHFELYRLENGIPYDISGDYKKRKTYYVKLVDPFTFLKKGDGQSYE